MSASASNPSSLGSACRDFMGSVLEQFVPTVSADTSVPSSEEEKAEETEGGEEEEEDEPEPEDVSVLCPDYIKPSI